MKFALVLAFLNLSESQSAMSRWLTNSSVDTRIYTENFQIFFACVNLELLKPLHGCCIPIDWDFDFMNTCGMEE